ncbi:MAG TPA: FUSC family protein [Verrucomicrobiae bacterium]|jgi:uncharacterized membrane protein YccC
MSRFFHQASFSYALALWLATICALLVSFIVQLEPAQWSAITVWIMFVQNPRLNYSKIVWWAFGTIVGAFVAVILTVCFNQAPELILLFLALWLALCAGMSTFVNSYRAYGAVLAGYTCAIVTMSAVENPDAIFRLAVTRVSCIFIGMTSAIFFITIFLPKHRHWRETLHHLGDHLKATIQQASRALAPDMTQPAQFTWRHMVDRLSTLEHTVDLTTAESAESRFHAPQAHSLIATLFKLLATAQSIEVHLARPGATQPTAEISSLFTRTQLLLGTLAVAISPDQKIALEIPNDEIRHLQDEIVSQRQKVSGQTAEEIISNQFLLDRLDELLVEFDYAIRDWLGLFGPWTARRPSLLAVHQDYFTAFIYGLRIFLAMGLASAIWFITEWPSGSQMVLFIAVVCSLLSLVDYAPLLGFTFVKSAVFCAVMAFVEIFWLLPRSEGFFILALMLGLFLLPAAYAYRHPRLIGGAVVSMLIFYGLTMPSNQMTYDIATFFNNGIALLCATVCGFFAFHAVPSLTPNARQFWLLRAARKELARGETGGSPLAEQRWTSRMFDRLRLLHRAMSLDTSLDAENEMLVSLQLGLRRHRLLTLLDGGSLAPEIKASITGVLREFHEIARHPNVLALFLRSGCSQFEDAINHGQRYPDNTISALAEMREMTLLIEASTRFYLK